MKDTLKTIVMASVLTEGNEELCGMFERRRKVHILYQEDLSEASAGDTLQRTGLRMETGEGILRPEPGGAGAGPEASGWLGPLQALLSTPSLCSAQRCYEVQIQC